MAEKIISYRRPNRNRPKIVCIYQLLLINTRTVPNSSPKHDNFKPKIAILKPKSASCFKKSRVKSNTCLGPTPESPHMKAHQLTGDRKGTWSLTITRNWRITFRIDQTEREILDLDYEDYH